MRTIVPAPKSLRELAQEKLGDALFLDVMRAEAEDPGDPEMRRYLCHDLNDVLSSCHTMENTSGGSTIAAAPGSFCLAEEPHQSFA